MNNSDKHSIESETPWHVNTLPYPEVVYFFVRRHVLQ